MTSEKRCLAALSRRLGLELKLDESASLTLNTPDGTVLLKWLERSQAFVFYADIGRLGSSGREQILMEMLKANFLYSQTDGGAVSYNEINYQIGVNFLIPTENLDPERFPERFERMMASASRLRGKLLILSRAAARQDSPAPDLAQLGSTWLPS